MQNKQSKRVKINFETINGCNYKIIPPEKITESNVRIKKEMEKNKKIKRYKHEQPN